MPITNKPNADNVSAAKPSITGAVAVAPIGTTLPTTAAGALDAAFTRLGYVTEDGVTNSTGIESTAIKAWGGDVVLNVKTSQDDTFKFSLLEILNPDVVKAVYGDGSVSGDLATGLAVTANSLDTGAHSYVIDMILNNDFLRRIVIPSGTVTARDDITYKADTAIAYGLTISATPDSDGNTHYEYTAKNGGKS